MQGSQSSAGSQTRTLGGWVSKKLYMVDTKEEMNVWKISMNLCYFGLTIIHVFNDLNQSGENVFKTLTRISVNSSLKSSTPKFA